MAVGHIVAINGNRVRLNRQRRNNRRIEGEGPVAHALVPVHAQGVRGHRGVNIGYLIAARAIVNNSVCHVLVIEQHHEFAFLVFCLKDKRLRICSAAATWQVNSGYPEIDNVRHIGCQGQMLRYGVCAVISATVAYHYFMLLVLLGSRQGE